LLNEPSWLPIEAVIEHNRLEAEATGERHFLRDRGLLESALARPRNFFGFGEEDVVVRWAEEVIALVEHRSTEEDFARSIRPYIVAT
jgi:death on curing protein